MMMLRALIVLRRLSWWLLETHAWNRILPCNKFHADETRRTTILSGFLSAADGADDDTGDEGAATAVAEADNADEPSLKRSD